MSDPCCLCTDGRIASLAAYLHSSLHRTSSLPRHQEIESTVGGCPARPMYHHFNSLSSANSRSHALFRWRAGKIPRGKSHSAKIMRSACE